MKFVLFRSVLLLCFFVCCSALGFAQREQAGIRFEYFGPRSIPAATPNSFNGAIFGNTLLTVNGGFQTQLDKEGSMILNSQFVYRNANSSFPSAKAANGDFTYSSITAHAIYYEGIYLQTLSDKFQLALALRAGIFTDFNNVNLSHFRAEPLFFLDYFFDDKFIAGLGFVYNTSNFGRLISVPLLHIYWIPSSEVLVDGLLPTRLDVWYYPSKQVDLGISITLNGSQFQLGKSPNIQGIDRVTLPTAPFPNTARNVADINQMFFANATIGPNIRYNVFDKTYVSIEGGYSLVRRFGFDNSVVGGGGVVAGRNDTDFIASYLRGFDFSVNTWFVRAGIQIMY
jgi:Domain of unknown function (DUF6268)